MILNSNYFKSDDEPLSMETKMKKEYETLQSLIPSHDETDFTTACLLENYSKNRYCNVLPIEDTRVKVTGDTNSDYINANFVNLQVSDGIEMKFICTQAPLLRTCEEFWRMVWDQNCQVICALNRLIENNLVKGDRYWPEAERKVQFGDISVVILSSLELKPLDIIIRCFQLSCRNSRREVYHLHYQGWPDFGVPESSLAIRELVNLMLFYQKKGTSNGLFGPVVVHCSAGIGRSGAFMTIAAVMSDPKFKELVNNRSISKQKKRQTRHKDHELFNSLLCKFGIADLVLHLRRQRHPGTVQTQHQYNFIYTALSDEYISPTILSTALCSVLHWHDKNDKNTSPSILSRSGPVRPKTELKRSRKNEWGTPLKDAGYDYMNRQNCGVYSDLSCVFNRTRQKLTYEEGSGLGSLSSSSESIGYGYGDSRGFLCKSGLL
jgi:protein tyrosine phosphatase